MPMSCKADIERILKSEFAPSKLVVTDDSARHAGHAQAQIRGGGHYIVEIVSERFEGLSHLQRQRLINTALALLMKKDIHALSLKTFTPAESDQVRNL